MESYVKIRLDNYNNVCSGGQTLVGRVECMFTSEETIRAIRIQFNGRAEVQWYANRKNHIGEEIYFDQLFNLVGGNEDTTIPAGRHEYPFSYKLPDKPLPSPFSEKYGNVKYKIRVTVNRPWKVDYEDEFLLNVFSLFDLSCLPAARKPFAKSTEETLSICCFTPGSITFSVSLPFTGYTAGQKINVGTNIKNMSNVNVASVEYEIIRTTEFIAHRPVADRTRSEYIVALENVGAVGSHAEKSWTTALIVSPAEVPNLINCSIISVSYRLQVKAILPFPHSNIKISCPLTFGTQPLTETNTNATGLSTQLNSYATARINEATPFLQNVDISFPYEQDVGSSTGLKQATAPPSYEDVKN